jgi:opacity protein-like surface antigen
MKKIALALLATSSYANTNHIDHHHGFAVELAGGLAMMGGAPYSDTEIPIVQQGDQVLNDLKFSRYTGTTDNATFNVGSDIPIGYRSQWHTMVPNANNKGVEFAGQLNLHYMMKSGSLGAGVYAGIGYNGVRSSSTYTDTFDNTIYNNAWAQTLGPNESFSVPNGTILKDHPAFTFLALGQSMATDDQIAMNADMPVSKATISSGLMLQAGARLGPIIGRFFPHLRVGWAAYQLRAHMTNQMPAYNAESAMGADSYYVNAAITPADGFVVGDHVADPAPPFGANNIAVNNSFKDMDPLFVTPERIKVASKRPQWSNAVTLGAGLDWSMNNKIMLGVYYQAAICQRVHFNQWNKDVTGGMTSSTANFPTENQTGIGTDPVATSGKVITPYGSTPPTVSIDPIIQTVMFSAKYVINKT